MALSNWDMLAFDSEGKQGNGVLSTGPASVEIYKNKLYIRDERMWHEDLRWVKPTIMEVYSGNIYASDFEIFAARHETQDSVFCYVESMGRNVMAGVGCYGFMTSLDYAIKMGLDLNLDWHLCSEYAHGVSKRYLGRFYNETENNVEVEKIEVPTELILENEWLGVTKDTYEAFIAWLNAVKDESNMAIDWLEKVKNSTAIQFNQGNAYL